MLKWLMRKGIAAFERKWDYDASYVHELIDADPLAAWKFSKAAAIGSYRKDVPLAAWTAAAITAVRHEDCGPCTQLGVSMAEKSGVDPKVLRAILSEDAAAMPDDVALAWRFTRAALDHHPIVDEYRQEIVRRWGPRAVISLAFAMVASRTYPTVKYAMGHGQTCARVVVGRHARHLRSRRRIGAARMTAMMPACLQRRSHSAPFSSSSDSAATS